MSNFLKQAHAAGVQDALVNFGIAKKAGVLSAFGRNPALAGAGVGAVGGAIAGGEDNRLLGALAGGALGAGAGHMGAKGVSNAFADNTELGQSVHKIIADRASKAGTGMAGRVRGMEAAGGEGALYAAGAAGVGGGLGMNALGLGDAPERSWYDPRGWGG